MATALTRGGDPMTTPAHELETHHREAGDEPGKDKKGLAADWEKMPKWEKGGVFIAAATLVFLVITWLANHNGSSTGASTQLPQGGNNGYAPGFAGSTQSSDMWPPLPAAPGTPTNGDTGTNPPPAPQPHPTPSPIGRPGGPLPWQPSPHPHPQPHPTPSPIGRPGGPLPWQPNPHPQPQPQPTASGNPLIPYGQYSGPSYSNLAPNTRYTYQGTTYTLVPGASGRLWGKTSSGQQVLLYGPPSQYH